MSAAGTYCAIRQSLTKQRFAFESECLAHMALPIDQPSRELIANGARRTGTIPPFPGQTVAADPSGTAQVADHGQKDDNL